MMSETDRKLRIADLAERRSKAHDEVAEIEQRVRATTGVLRGLITSLDDLYNGPQAVVLDIQLHAIEVSDTEITYDKHAASADAFESLVADLARLQWLRSHIGCLDKNLKSLGINH